MADQFKNNRGKYDDILNLPHHVSTRHPHMSLHDRAAQFAPFAALTGYGDELDETARYTSVKRALSDSEKESMDKKLGVLAQAVLEKPEITVTYFVEDLFKEGGSEEQYTGLLKRIHEYRKVLIFEDGKEISIEDILSMECDLFDRYEL